MKENILKEIHVDYQPGKKKFWEGRKSNPTLENQYWHQEIKLKNIHDLQNDNATNIALLGYVCDEGVRRNLGRVGAQKGPNVLRERLSKLPKHFDTISIADVGDLICIDDDMESCQHGLTVSISKLISQGIFPIVIGGGHDVAYGHFMGIRNAVKNTDKKKIGIINFDAHFDLRPVDEKPNSGTPFNQILSELNQKGETVNYFAIGIQQQSNTKELFSIAKENHVDFALSNECESTSEAIQTLQEKLHPFIEKNDYIYITIDMDGFSSAYAPGVSAPSPLGFSPNFIFKILHFLFDSNKVISCDIAELNPRLDQDNLTANLAARLVDFMVMKLNKKSIF